MLWKDIKLMSWVGSQIAPTKAGALSVRRSHWKWDSLPWKEKKFEICLPLIEDKKYAEHNTSEDEQVSDKLLRNMLQLYIMH